MDKQWWVRKSIGVVSTALGLFLLWASPVSTVACSKGADGVTCRIDRALLGVWPLTGAQIEHVRAAEVSYNTPSPPINQTSSGPPTANNTYQLVLITAARRVSPRGVDASSSDPLREIADQINDLVKGEGGPFSQRNYNGFPTVAGSIFFFLGALIVVSG